MSPPRRTGAPARKIAFTVPTGNFGDIFAGYAAARMGLPVDHLVIATNVNDILARALKSGAYELHEVTATASPSMDIQVASNFERALFEATGRDARAVRTMMGALVQSRRFVIPARALAEACGPPFAPITPTSRKPPPPSARYAVRPATSSTRIPRSQSRLPRRNTATGRRRWSCCRPHPAKFPGRGRSRLGCAPRCPEWLADLPTQARTSNRSPRRSDGGRAFHFECQPRSARRSSRMSVEVSRLPSGLIVVTDTMPHLETTGWTVSILGSRDESPEEHGVSHMLEHMAFKGTRRRSARAIAEEIEAVGGDLDGATGHRDDGLYARVLRADVPLALDVLSDILRSRPSIPTS